MKYNPTWGFATYWTLINKGEVDMPEGFPEFDQAIDWCGPADDAAFSAMVPDKILESYVGQAGYRHDHGYATPAALRPAWCRGQYLWRLLCDYRFRSDLKHIIKHDIKSPARRKQAAIWVRLYYWSVRCGGWRHCAK
mgnify:CR=1 FL=1